MAHGRAKAILEGELRLKMHPEKTKVVHFDEGFRFLGLDLWKDYMVLPKIKVKKYKDKVRNITRRQQGNNLHEMITKLNELVRGFGNYYGIGNVKSKISTTGRMDTHEGTCFHAQEKVYGFQLANPKQSVGTSGNGISDELAHHAFLIQG